MWTDNPIKDSYRYQAEQDKYSDWLESMPKCDNCGKHITDRTLWELSFKCLGKTIVLCDHCHDIYEEEVENEDLIASEYDGYDD